MAVPPRRSWKTAVTAHLRCAVVCIAVGWSPAPSWAAPVPSQAERGLDAGQHQGPGSTSQLPWDFFYGFLGLAALGLAAFGYGMTRVGGRSVQVSRAHDDDMQLPTARLGRGLGNTQPQTLVARGETVTLRSTERLAVRDVIPGLRAGDPRVIGFLLRGGGLATLVLSSFLAVGCYLLATETDGSGWLFIGVVGLFVGVTAFRVATAGPPQPPERR